MMLRGPSPAARLSIEFAGLSSTYPKMIIGAGDGTSRYG